MAIAHVVSVGAQQNAVSNNAVSAAVDTSAASLIIIALSAQSTSQRGLQTDVYGNYYTPLGWTDSANNGHGLYYCVNPRVGASHVFSHYGTINTRCGFVASAFSGTALWDVWTRVETGAAVNNLTSVGAPTLTPLRDDSLVVVGASHQTTSFSIGGGFTIAAQQPFFSATNVVYGGGLAYLIQTAAAAAAPTVTYSASTWGAVRQTYFLNSPYVVLSSGRLLNAAPNYSVKQLFSTAGQRNAGGLSGRLAGLKNYHGGSYHIAGITTCDELPVARTVYLMIHRNAADDSPLLRATPADVIAVQRTVDGVGTFDFRYLQPGNYTTISVDPAGAEDDVIRTNIPAVAM